ncbi:MAG: hypothetical protein WCF65_04910 [Parachlamydiaceae bacterium]
MINEFLSQVKPVFSGHGAPVYKGIVCDTLRRLLVDRMGLQNDENKSGVPQLREQFFSSLPLVTATKCHEVPGTMSFFALMRHRANAFKFFFDMVNGWLLPGRRSNVVLIYSADFQLLDVNDDVYTLCEVMIRVETKKELDQITDNLPALETELQMGLASSYDARRILEIKGFSRDEKTALIQDNIAYLIDHRPADFDQDVLTEMQHVLLICREDFKEARECRHLSRIIGIHYLFRKGLREAVKKFPQKRHFKLKLFRSRIKHSDGHKTVLAVLIGVNFFRDKEALDKPHLLKAIQHYVPTARPIENSFFANRRGSEPICTMYLELEKGNGAEFSSEEIRLLRQKLSADLQNRIKHLLHPVFMPRNEEEIIRNILSLSSQIKYLRDIPQVFISFDEQTHTHVFFTVILVRVERSDNLSIHEMFKNSNTSLKYIHDRIQNAGSLRRKHKKEATVFRVKLHKDQFLRADHTIDLNRARQIVIEELFNIMGEIRDFNGGMISKQHEVLIDLKALLSELKYSDLMLENFFYSLTPVIMRNVLEPEAMRTLFLMLMSAIEAPLCNDETYSLNVVSDPLFVFITVKAVHRSVRDEIARLLIKLSLHSSQLAIASIPVQDVTHLGYIYRSDDAGRRQQFIQVINHALAAWKAGRPITTSCSVKLD